MIFDTGRIISWPRLLLGLIVTGICALSVHVVMLQVLHVPFPELSAIRPMFRFAGRAVGTLGLIVFWQLAVLRVKDSFLIQWGTLSLVGSMLTEILFRSAFMEGYCTTAFTFTFVSDLPRVASMVLLCGLVVATARWLPLPWQQVLAAVVITAAMTFLAAPLISGAMAPVMKAIAGLAPEGEWCTMPYGPRVLIPSYLSFAEPVFACFLAAALVWDRLSDSRGMRFLQFALIILAMKNQLITPFVYAAFAKIGLLRGLASEGQFALEALTLAVLTGMSWEWSVRWRDSAGLSG